MKIKLLERDIQRLIVDYCNANGIFVQRRNVAGMQKLSGGRYVQLGKKGMADLWGIHHGIHWECEVKRPGETPRLNQVTWLNLCTSYGACAFWADSLEMFVENIGRI